MSSARLRFSALFSATVALAVTATTAAIPAEHPPQISAAVSVSISPRYAPLLVGHSLQLSATVNGATNPAVWWQVDGIIGGNATVGTISTTGLFTAAATIPSPAIVNITAVSQTLPTARATATLTLENHAATGKTYYVSTAGSDSNSGSFTAPWRHIQHAANSVHAGDSVYVRGGVYNEYVSFPTSGSSSSGYITFSSYPGELATLDGSGLSVPGGQWGLFTLVNRSYIVLNGFEVRNYKTASTADVPIGIYVTGAGTQLQILNNHIHDIVTSASTCNANALGIAIYGDQTPASLNNVAVSGNQLDHLTTGCSESMSLDGNVTNFAVTGNLIHDNDNIGIDAIGFEPGLSTGSYNQARYGVIRGNTVYNISSYFNPAYSPRGYAAGGIYVDGGAHITIEQNLVHHTDIGIELASEHLNHVTSYVTARNNVIYAANSVGISIGGADSSSGGTQNCTIVNNTLYGDDTKNTYSGEFQIQYHDSSNIFENNVLYATSQGLLLNGYTKNALTPAAIDYNLYYSTIGASNAQWIYQGTTYTGYSNYLKTPNDQHSPAFSNPKFVSLTAPLNLDLQSGSPAIHLGTNLGAGVVGTFDFNGHPRVNAGLINLGAYEQ